MDDTTIEFIILFVIYLLIMAYVVPAATFRINGWSWLDALTWPLAVIRKLRGK